MFLGGKQGFTSLSNRPTGVQDTSKWLRNRIKATRVRCLATGRNYYELLAVPPDASPDDIRTAFRQRAKELHPDVNKEEDADELFIECKEAYETLSDASRRAAYDRAHGLRRPYFFQDVDVGAHASNSPFRWSAMRPGDDSDEDEEGEEEAPGSSRQAEDEEDADSRDGDPGAHEFSRLEEIMRLLERNRGLQQWQTGRTVDPWGDSSTDAWRRQVEKQSGINERFRRRPDFSGLPDDHPGLEWQPPQRQWDREDQRGPGAPGQGGNSDNGGGRQPFRI